MALAEVDKAPFGWYHVRLAVVTGIGFFTDAYSVSTVSADHVEAGTNKTFSYSPSTLL